MNSLTYGNICEKFMGSNTLKRHSMLNCSVGSGVYCVLESRADSCDSTSIVSLSKGRVSSEESMEGDMA